MRARAALLAAAFVAVIAAGGGALVLTLWAGNGASVDPAPRPGAAPRGPEPAGAPRGGRRHVGAAGDVTAVAEPATEPEGPVTREQRLQWIREWMEIACGGGYAWKDRMEAQRALWEFDAEESVPILLEWATNPDPEAPGWGWAMSILQSLGPRAKSAVPAMARLLRRDGDRAGSAAFTLGRIGPAAVPTLLEALRDEDAAVRNHGLEGLSALVNPPREAIDAVLGLVGSDDADVRGRAIGALYRGKAHAAVIVPVVATALSDPDESVRSQAVMLLLMYGGRSGPAVPALHDALRDDSAFVGETAARALGFIGPEARGETDTLVALLAADPDRWRKSIPGALAGLGPAALLTGVASDSADVRALTIPLVPAAVKADGAFAEAAVAALDAALASASDDVRIAAAQALGRLGPTAAAAAPTLLRLTDDENARVRRAALIAAARTGGARDRVLDVLVRELTEGPDVARAAAAEALGEIGADAAAAVDALAGAVNDRDVSVRVRAARALEALGPVAVTATSALAGRLADDAEEVRLAVAVALIAVDPPGLAARDTVGRLRISNALSIRRGLVEGLGRHPGAAWVSVVVDRLDDRSTAVRIAAAQSLAKFGGHAATVVPALAARLERERGTATRFALVEALARHGKASAEAVPLLEAIAANAGTWMPLRNSARDALAKIR